MSWLGLWLAAGSGPAIFLTYGAWRKYKGYALMNLLWVLLGPLAIPVGVLVTRWVIRSVTPPEAP